MTEGLEGTSLAQLLKNPEANWNKPAFTQIDSRKRNGKSIRTERWRYTEWENGNAGAELYDHDNDPRELNNLAKDSRYARTIEKLKAALR